MEIKRAACSAPWGGVTRGALDRPTRHRPKGFSLAAWGSQRAASGARLAPRERATGKIGWISMPILPIIRKRIGRAAGRRVTSRVWRTGQLRFHAHKSVPRAGRRRGPLGRSRIGVASPSAILFVPRGCAGGRPRRRGGRQGVVFCDPSPPTCVL
jgi:hypothetical protein